MLVGIDVGGTFTDFVTFDPTTRAFRILKRPTSPEDQSIAIAAGLRELSSADTPLERVVHGTTTATNAVIERAGARTALITNRGFRDVLEFGRRDRPQPYGLGNAFIPLVTRADRHEIGGRLHHDGTELEPIDEDEVRQLGERFAQIGYEAVAVCLLHSYADSSHEERVGKVLGDACPKALVFLSSRVYPEPGEFERSSTTVICAYVGPTMSSYLGRLATRLVDLGFTEAYQVVRSNGSCAPHVDVMNNPVTTLNSGPAAGVVGALAIAAGEGVTDMITLDMGGTSADIAVIVDGELSQRVDNSIGFRLPLQLPMLDISAIGAGGGSIASLDESGVLSVGPRSAGSVPGPVCYGKGGREPTVTDANVVLGCLPRSAAERSGLADLDYQAAVAAIDEKIARPLGISVTDAAQGIRDVVNETMAGHIRLNTIDYGRDPSEFWLFSFGGGGALHACALVRKLGLKGALVPVTPGVTSALGCLLLDARHDSSSPVRRYLDELAVEDLHRVLQIHYEEGKARLERQGFPRETCRQIATFSLRFAGQFHSVSLTVEDIEDLSIVRLRKEFRRIYANLYGGVLESRVYLASIRSSTIAPIKTESSDGLTVALLGSGMSDAVASVEPATSGTGLPSYRRDTLRPGSIVEGPAVIVQPDATILVESGFRATVAESRVLYLTQVDSDRDITRETANA